VGDTLTAVAGEQQARALIQKRQKVQQQARTVSLDNLYDQITTGEVKELSVVLKVDVQGSIEPVRSSLERLSAEEVKLRIIHSGSGNITESDVMLAIASKGLIIGFGTAVEAGARRLADMEGVDIRTYDVIYNLVDDMEKALKGLLEPRYVEVIEGRAEVKALFSTGKKEKVAGVYVSEGKISRGAPARVRRGEQIVYESEVISLRRFKDSVNEVTAGYECGVGIRDFSDFQVGDIVEIFRREQAKR
jgi:translation initiation factor IF-2